MLPFLAQDVAALKSLLPYLPFLGLATAFAGSFMLAWSQRAEASNR